MSRWNRVLGAIVSVCVFAACGGDDGGGGASSPPGGSCNASTNMRCVEYTGTQWTNTSTQVGCSITRGAWSAGRCPTTSVAGSCVTGNAASQLITVYYTGADVAAAMSACAMSSGTWRAP